MRDDFLVLKNISKRFVGVKALDSVGLVVKAGEIHCLVGENGSGKSTLVKIISGVERPDEGELIVGGQPVIFSHSIDSIRRGIEVIYQDMSLFPNLTVSENIVVNQRIEHGDRTIRWKQTKAIAQVAMQKIRIDIDLDTIVGTLSIANQQMVAICRALTSDVRLLILDEATTALTKKEIDTLFGVIKDLQSKGISVVFVSHKLNEVIQIAEAVTILRDGKSVGTFENKELTDDKITFLMTGRKIEKACLDSEKSASPIAMEAKGLGKKFQFSNVSFALRQGEILGLTGLLGAGRTELALALFGLNKPDTGEIRVFGKRVRIRSVRDAVRLGIGYVPENRMVQGLIMQQSVANNLQMTTIHDLTGALHLLSAGKRGMFIKEWVQRLGIKVADVATPVQTLSGGNQQKVVIAKWLATAPKILILDGPTVGIDIAAKANIHQMVRELAKNGIAVLLISDEVSEVLNNCDRILIMKNGILTKEFASCDATKELIQEAIEAKEA
jgi:simple sugar transport system ATP-binding protein